MQCGDGCLHLVGSGAAVQHRLVDQRQTFRYQLAVPCGAILILQKDHSAVCVEARPRPGMLQKQKRRQSHDFGLGRVETQKKPRQPYRLVAKRCAHRRVSAAGRVAFVEDEIDHGGDSTKALRPFDRSGRLEGHRCVGDLGLGARDALFHRAFADQKCARDLLHLKA